MRLSCNCINFLDNPFANCYNLSCVYVGFCGALRIMQMWWNRQTRYLEGVVSYACAGSSPAICTKRFGQNRYKSILTDNNAEKRAFGEQFQNARFSWIHMSFKAVFIDLGRYLKLRYRPFAFLWHMKPYNLLHTRPITRNRKKWSDVYF